MADTRLAKIGITVKEPWANNISYEVLDYTLWRVQDEGDGCGYIALRDNIGVTPNSDPTVWAKATEAGQSIYDLAVKYGHFVGTEEEFEAQYQQVLQDARDAATATNATNREVQDAEALRVSAETGRVNAENARVDAEGQRASAEATRQNNEVARGNAEGVRVSHETDRVSAENGRVLAETGRVNAETGRVNAEDARVSEFASIKTDAQTAIGQADAAATRANTAAGVSEADHLVAVADHTQAGDDHTLAVSDHGTASDDHTLAGTDHTTATSDHGIASEDHTTAIADHGTAGDDHTLAVADHGTAGDDHTRAESDHTRAEADHESIADKANIDGWYSGMTVGLAENLVDTKGTGTDQTILRRTSCGTESITDDGSAIIQEVIGNSFTWNQLFNPTLIPTFSERGITVTNNGDGTFTFNGFVESSPNVFSNEVTLSNDGSHKFYFKQFGGVQSQVQLLRNGTLWSGDWRNGIIAALGGDTKIPLTMRFHISYGEQYTNVTLSFIAIDLTLIFGAGNEPSTVADFEAWLAANVGVSNYYGYTPGMIVNNTATGIKTVGFNQYNPETGKVNVLAGNEYQITGTYTALSLDGETITPDADGLLTPAKSGELTVTGGNNSDTCVHLTWSGYRNGEYEPYWERTLELNIPTLTGKKDGEGSSVTIAPDGLKSVGNVYDYGVVENGLMTSIVKKIGSRDYASGDESDSSVLTDGTTTLYVLENPETYVLDEPVPMAYKVADFGTEEIIPLGLDSTNLLPQSAPFKGVIKYNNDFTREIVNLPENYVRKDALKQGIGTATDTALSQKAVEDNYAHKTGVEDNLIVGAAKALAGDSVKSGEFIFRQVQGGSGLARMKEVKGNSLVWNQIIATPSFTSETSFTNGIKFINNGDGSVDVVVDTGGATAERYMTIADVSLLGGHKYYLPDGTGKGNTLPHARFVTYANGIFTVSEGASKGLRVVCPNGVAAGTYKVWVYCFDLTLAGIASQISTVADFTRLFPLPYYANNAGSILSNITTAMEVRGFNQWDEQWRKGYYDVSGVYHTDNNVCNTNPIPVLPDTVYYFQSPSSTGTVPIRFYDAGGNYISSVNVTNNARTFTTPANARYINFYVSTGYGRTYNNDICINLSDPSRNGQYEPYSKTTVAIPITTMTGKVNGEGESVTIFPEGAKSAGTVYDSIIVDNDGWARRAVVRTRKYVFTGEETWRSRTGGDWVCTNILDGAGATGSAFLATNSNITGIVNGQSYSQGVTALESTGATGTAVASAIAGAVLIYTLATPIEYVLDTPIYLGFQADSCGSEMQLPQNTDTPTTSPLVADIIYAIDAAKEISNLPTNYQSQDSMDALLSTLGTAMNGTFTKTWDATNNKWTFAFTPNAQGE